MGSTTFTITEVCDCPSITYNIGQITPANCGQANGSIQILNILNGSISATSSTQNLSAGQGTVVIVHDLPNCPNVNVPYNIPCSSSGCSGTDVCNGACQCVPETCNLTGQSCGSGPCVNDNSGTYNSDCECIGVQNCTSPPSLSCPNTITVEVDEPVSWTNTAFSSCDGSNIQGNIQCVSGPSIVSSPLIYGSTGTRTVTCTVTDNCGNTNSCSFQIIVIDPIPPNPCANNPCEGCGTCNSINNGLDYQCLCTGGCNQGDCLNTYTQSDGKTGCECITDPCNPNPCGPCQDCNSGVCSGPIIGESCEDNDICTFNTTIQSNCLCGGGQTSNCTGPCIACDGSGGCVSTCNQTCCEGTCVPECTAGFSGLCCCNGTLINKIDTCLTTDYNNNDCSCTGDLTGRCCYGANQCASGVTQTKCEGPGPLGFNGVWELGGSCPCPCTPFCPTNCGQSDACGGLCPSTDIGQGCPDPLTLCPNQTQDKDICGNNCPGIKDCSCNSGEFLADCGCIPIGWVCCGAGS